MKVLTVFSLLVGLSIASKDYHSIELPIKSKHNLEIIKSDSHVEDSSTKVEIPGGVLPVHMSFKTQSSPLYVKQEHRGTKGSHQKSNSKDEPHRLVHEVVKPVIQELKEIITPYRKIVQVIEPVREERLTKVHKNEGHNNDDHYGSNNDNNGYKNDENYGKEDQNDDHYHQNNDNYGHKNDEHNDDRYGKKNDDDYKRDNSKMDIQLAPRDVEYAESKSNMYFEMGNTKYNYDNNNGQSKDEYKSQSNGHRDYNSWDNNQDYKSQSNRDNKGYSRDNYNKGQTLGQVYRSEPSLQTYKEQPIQRYYQQSDAGIVNRVKPNSVPTINTMKKVDINQLYETARKYLSDQNNGYERRDGIGNDIKRYTNEYWNFLSKIGQSINY